MIHGPYNVKSVYLVGLHIYYKMVHGPYNIKFVYLVGLHIYYKMTRGPYNIKFSKFSSHSAKSVKIQKNTKGLLQDAKAESRVGDLSKNL